MGRAKRADEANGIYHMLNRANRRATIFKKDTDYGAFERILCEAAERFRVELFCYCLMQNHWKHGASSEKKLLSGWPIPRSPHWVDKVAMALSDRELKRLRWSERRGCPFGDDAWTESTARKFDLETTMRPRGRPRKFKLDEQVP